jgi:enoyl-CoA hydratase/carnithine racemase
MTANTIQLTVQDTTATLTFDRPDARNALTIDAMRAFAEAVEQLHAHPDLTAVILVGAGTAAFCAGGDIHEHAAYPTEQDGATVRDVMSAALNRLEALPCPVIGAINGYAVGGGSEIALACDLRVVDAAVQFGLVHRRVGLVPGWGAVTRLVRLVGYPQALALTLSAEVLNADAMTRLGLANQVVAQGAALETAQQLAADYATMPRDILYALKAAAQSAVRVSYHESLAQEGEPFPRIWAGAPHQEAVQRFIQRKKS